MGKKYIFEVVDLNTIDTKVFNEFPHKSVNTTKEWIEFIAEDSSATPYTHNNQYCRKLIFRPEKRRKIFPSCRFPVFINFQ